MKKYKTAGVRLVFAASTALLAGHATAVTFNVDPLVLPASVYGYVGVGGASSGLNSPGSVSIPAGVDGTASLSALLGAEPSVSVSVAPVSDGTGFVDLVYYVRYVDPLATTLVSVTFNISDIIAVSAGSPATAQTKATVYFPGYSAAFPPPVVNYYPYFHSPHCISTETGCDGGLSNASGLPLAPAKFDMVPNVAYKVQLTASVHAGAGASASAFIDPTFTAAPGSSGHFAYSAGVGPVPEPASWVLMLLGGAALALSAKRRHPGRHLRSQPSTSDC